MSIQPIDFPTGTVTFLFTDLEDSTLLWEEHPQAMQAALARHDVILKTAVETEQGTIIKTTGDGLHAAFSSAIDGVNAILAAQLALISEPWGETGQLRVRMALHSGQAELRDGDYYGSVVNRAARIMGTASGEQILVSSSTAALINDELHNNVTFLDLGKHHLRGLNSPERLYQILHPDLPAVFPPLKTRGTVPNNLPVEMTSFIGRAGELADIKQLLESDQLSSRLVTLTGPGGTGKTRLALQSAKEVLDQYPDGVWLVELAPVTNPNQVAQAVATPMGLREQAARLVELMIIDHLRSQQALLILDNCEHLIDECARLAEALLQTCPHLNILTTSREALGIPGERSVRVRSLSLPPEDEIDSMEKLVQYEAVHLFVERAESVRPGFTLDSSNAHQISQICRRLDGIPLAIELAAARVQMLTPEQIADRLDDRFRLLTGGSRTALPRQRTLQALIDWSFDLLSEDETTLLCRLSTFIGGWTLEAAEQVAGFKPIESFDVLALLEQLVNKSLIVVEDYDLHFRYHMLESIRQYAQDKLANNGEAEQMRDKHLSYYLDRSLKSFDALMNLEPPGDLGEKFKPEADNLRLAWAWALEVDIKSALGFASAFSLDWSQVVPLIEVFRFQQRVLELANSSPQFTAADAPVEDLRLLSRALVSASMVAFATRFLTMAVEFAEQSAVLAEQAGDMQTHTWARSILTTAAGFTVGKEALQKWLDEDYDRVMLYGTNYSKATSLVRWGIFHFFTTGRYDQESEQRWQEGMAMMRRSGNLWIQGNSLQITADLSKARNEPGEAKRLAEEVLGIYNDLGDMYAANPARSLLADLARQHGDMEQAAALYRKTILVWRDTGRAESGVRTLESLAYTMHAISKNEANKARQSRLVYAVKLISAASAVRQIIGSPVNFLDQAEYEQELAEIKEEAGESAFDSAWRTGQAMDFDQVILLAAEEPSLPDN